MTSRVIPVAPFVLVVFGATGNLARRKLLPALFQRDIAGQLPDEATILGVSRGPLSEDAYIAMARQAHQSRTCPGHYPHHAGLFRGHPTADRCGGTRMHCCGATIDSEKAWRPG